ncbi:MAG: family 20 glycosylhydrolase [Muribaculaceae bacterium]|nr:family 20 glycosylhydrolase [Muribaculaceae bacterium]
MKTFSMTILALASAMSLVGCSESASYKVIPLPNSIELSENAAPFVINSGTTIVAEGEEMERNANMLAKYIDELTGIEVGVNTSGKPIVLRASLASENKEAYRMSVCADSIVIEGASAAGVFYGMQTLRKSLPATDVSSVEMPAGVIDDAPRFGYRGAHFDVSRHFYTIDEVKTFIDMMALHNLNTFHWHLTDDQGWRIEIKKYPKLIEVGSNRKETVIGRLPGKWDGKPHGGYYTQEQAREVVEYAAERYINVIPEIDMPGHMRAAIASYPQFGCTGKQMDVWTEWGVAEDVLCAGNDSTMAFIKDVLNEIMDIFPSKYIHIGGDECPKVRWKECPKCQARIRAEKITPKGKFSAEDRLQGYVTRFAYDVIKERGRVMIGWDEILESDIPSDAIVTSWRGDDGAVEGANRGNKVILSPNTHLYFDFYQSKDVQYEPFAIGGYIPVEKVYSFEPIPAELTGDKADLVIGAQANLWTEYILDFAQVQYMELPRMAALAEVLWTQPDKKNFDCFKDRIPALFAIYDRLGYNYAKHLADITATYTPVPEKKALSVDFTTLKGREIHYTLDGSEPTEKSAKYEGELFITDNAIVKAASFASGKPSRVLCDTITVNKATFCKAVLNSTPAEGYAFAGAPTFVDGITGTQNYRTGRWVGFVNGDCDVTIDLGAETEFSEVGFNCCVFQCDGVVDASGVEVKVSSDGNEFAAVASETYPEIDRNFEFGSLHHSVKFDTCKARYVNVVIKSIKALPAWHAFAASPAFVFVDEISVD